jgi:hypothetical protein
MNRISLKPLTFLLFTSSFTACSVVKNNINYTKDWQGSDVPGHNFATFQDFNGKQEFDLKLPANGPFYFKYVTAVQKGQLHFTLKSSSKEIISKDLQGSSQDSIRIEKVAGEKYKIVLEADHAAGKFDFKYGAL